MKNILPPQLAKAFIKSDKDIDKWINKNLIGKEVEITIKEVKKNKVKKNWKHSASVDLKGKADKINIRDLAYE